MWQLDASHARLQSPRLSCQLDLASPATGLTAVKSELRSERAFNFVGAAPMQLKLPVKGALLADAYVRGDDLVATYAESADYPCRTQVYWRYEQEPDYFGIQMIVSVQTFRLAAAPGLTVATRLPAPPEIIRDEITVMPLAEAGLCYAELVDRSNIDSTTVSERQVIHHLFRGTLEKGVIRRARLLACFLPAESAAEIAARVHEQFIRSELPLTT